MDNMQIIVKKTAQERKQESVKEAKLNDTMLRAEIAKTKTGNRDKNAGYSKPGYNLGLGKYIRDKDDYKREVAKKKREDPTFEEMS